MANYSEVKAVCERLKREGQTINVDALAKHLDGSRSSIVVHYDHWCSEQDRLPSSPDTLARAQQTKIANDSVPRDALANARAQLNQLSEKVPGSFSRVFKMSKQMIKGDKPAMVKHVPMQDAAELKQSPVTVAADRPANADSPTQKIELKPMQEIVPEQSEPEAEVQKDTNQRKESVDAASTAAISTATSSVQVLELEQQIEILHQEQEELLFELKLQRGKAKELTEESTELHQQFTDAQQTAIQRQKALNEVQEKIVQQQNELNRLNDLVADLEQQRHEAQQAKRQGDEQYELLAQKVDALQMANAELKSGADAKQSKSLQLTEQKLEQAQQELAQLNGQIPELEQQLQKAEQARVSFQEKYDAQLREQKTLEDKLKARQERFAEQETVVSDLEKERDQSKQEINNLQQKIVELEQSLLDQTADIEQLSSQLPEMRSQHEFVEQEQELQRLRSRVQVMESKIAHLQSTNSMLKEQSEVTSSHQSRQRETIKLQRDENKQLREAQHQFEQEREQLQQRCSKLEEQLSFVKGNTTSTVERLTLSNQQAQQKIKSLELQLKTMSEAD